MCEDSSQLVVRLSEFIQSVYKQLSINLLSDIEKCFSSWRLTNNNSLACNHNKDFTETCDIISFYNHAAFEFNELTVLSSWLIIFCSNLNLLFNLCSDPEPCWNVRNRKDGPGHRRSWVCIHFTQKNTLVLTKSSDVTFEIWIVRKSTHRWCHIWHSYIPISKVCWLPLCRGVIERGLQCDLHWQLCQQPQGSRVSRIHLSGPGSHRKTCYFLRSWYHL